MNTLHLSARASILRASPTLGITSKANALKAQGVDVVSFAAGEPDFPTPQPVTDAAIDALNRHFTRYTPSAGIPELKQAIADKLARDNGLNVAPEQVVVSCGAKHSVYNAMQVLVDPGDEVLLVAPYWMTYADQIRLAGGVPVVIHTDAAGGFVPSYEALKEAVTARTKAMILNSPSNPTGAVWPRARIKEVAALALSRGLWIVADEIYEKLVYGAPHVSVASLSKDVAERTVTINGCSKAYAMTGWRIGYAAAPLPVAKAMSSLQDQVTSNPTSFAQKGAVAALGLPPEAVETMRAEFEKRRNLIVKLLNQIPGVRITPPEGAFYAFADFSELLGGKVKTDLELADYLLDEARVATVPGTVFEGPGHLRLSYATGTRDIEKGVDRIAEAVRRLHT